MLKEIRKPGASGSGFYNKLKRIVRFGRNKDMIEKVKIDNAEKQLTVAKRIKKTVGTRKEKLKNITNATIIGTAFSGGDMVSQLLKNPDVDTLTLVIRGISFAVLGTLGTLIYNSIMKVMGKKPAKILNC
ncbi:MAG: hypothetical protein ABIH83_05905 [Candidatus Micrarchaeota archaeon]